MTIIFSIVLLLYGNVYSYGTHYGLRFAGAEVHQYQRTGLDLNPKRFFSFKDGFTITFQLSFPSDLHRYYGYVLRVIDENDNNIDLVFGFRGVARTSLNVIYGGVLTDIILETDLNQLFDQWHEISLTYDARNLQLTLSLDDEEMVTDNIHLSDRVKILFGGTDYRQFRTTDVPPMILKDIKISSGTRLLHHWPLNENEGTVAKDHVRRSDAEVSNPIWIKHLFQNWEHIHSDTIVGHATVAFNAKDGSVYLVGQNNMKVYSVSESRAATLRYNNSPHGFTQGRQAVYDTIQNRITVFNIRNTTFSTFDFDSLEWDNIFSGPWIPAFYWHYNKHYSPEENVLLVFGGYGQYEYRNIIQRFSLSTNGYDTLRTTGDTYHPRYLAALGAIDDTIFLLGGRGSVSGRQIEDPRSFYDLMAFSKKDNRFIKRYDFEPPVNDAVFANSMVIDYPDKSFYALMFSFYEFHNYLQLVKGSIVEPKLEFVGDRIPFKFEDIVSYADLYYCPLTEKLLAVTLFYDNNLHVTNASIYSISFPPDTVTEEERKSFLLSNWLFYAAAITVLLLVFFIWYRNYKKNMLLQGTCKLPGTTIGEALQTERTVTTASGSSLKNTVLFFGGFKVFNRDSVDITNKFSPLLKEIFLVIWLHSLNDHHGVSSEKLKELFWFHKNDKKAMNNRAVNLAKIKCLLEEIETCQLSRETGYWRITFDKQVVYNDYQACRNLANNKKVLDKEDILKLISIIEKGSFLEDLHYEWLDSFKAGISNLIIDTLVNFGLSFDIQQHPDFILDLANAIFYFDIVNEEAMILKCKALIASGKHSLAKQSYTEFVKNYKSLYDNPFEKSFSEVISKSDEGN